MGLAAARRSRSSACPIPGIGYLAYIEDPEGNIVGLMQPDMSAR